jgi:hypothetical protein
MAAMESFTQAIPSGAVQPPNAYSIDPSNKTTRRLSIASTTIMETVANVIFGDNAGLFAVRMGIETPIKKGARKRRMGK